MDDVTVLQRRVDAWVQHASYAERDALVWGPRSHDRARLLERADCLRGCAHQLAQAVAVVAGRSFEHLA